MARKKKKPPEDNELRWLTTYGDVVTLLLAFFVMLYAISQVDQQKFQLFVTGLADPFGNPAVSNGLLTDGSALVGSANAMLGDNALDGVALLDGLPEMEEDAAEAELQEGAEEPGDEPGAFEEEPLNTEGITTLDQRDLFEVQAALFGALDDAGLGEVVDFEIDTRGLTIAIATDGVLFASGSSDLGGTGRDIIGVIAPTLAGFTNQILVEGHTDTVPIGRPGYDNWNLSADRALAVLKLLVADHAIEPVRLAATGFGEFRPKTDNATTEGKATNRRVELVIVAEGGEIDGV